MHNSIIRPILALIAAGIVLFSVPAKADSLENELPLSISSPVCILMEAETETMIFEKNAHKQQQVASLVKLMSSLLFMKAVDEVPAMLDEQVAISPNAASAKGSTALLDANRIYRFEDLLRASIMISANDATVALAEHLSGSEEAFTTQMNQAAKELGLENTFFANCTGLNADPQHSSAYDIAVIASDLTKHKSYFKYSSLWVSDFIHPSGRVTGLTNPNRLVRFYTGCDGMKTGSSPEAGYCICASAEKDGMRLIAVILGASSGQVRFDEAKKMLEYGLNTYKRVQVIAAGELTGYTVPVLYGAKERVEIASGKGLSMLLRDGQEKQLSVELSLPESVTAPMLKDTKVGTISIYLNKQKVAELPAVLAEDARLPGYVEGLHRILNSW